MAGKTTKGKSAKGKRAREYTAGGRLVKTPRAEPMAGKGKNPEPRQRGSFLRRLLGHHIVRSLMAILLILALLPVLFMLIYKIPGTTPVSTLIMGRAVLAKPVERIWINLDNIAPVLPQSVIMSEDGQFCFHQGIDWRELNAVIDDALEGEKTRGASTLTMQLVKNLFLWPHRSLIRKVLEMPYAVIADLLLSKRRILEIYLNVAEWDEGIFGIEAASRHYFNRAASKLTRRQAALLAVTLPGPVSRNPAKPTRSLNRLANRIERLSRKSGAYIKCLKTGS